MNHKQPLLLSRLQSGEALTLGQQLSLAAQLSIPAMLAQVSVVVMEYIDASMVGSLGANASGAIGLVATSTWLFGGLNSAVTAGFTVQVAQRLGANETREARAIEKQALLMGVAISMLLLLAGVTVSGVLPQWLGGEEALWADASSYFLIYMLMLPVSQIEMLAGGLLQSSGNMRTPGLLSVLMCCMDVVFNALLIFPPRAAVFFGHTIALPGAGLGVKGAALGTALAEGVTALLMLYFVLRRSPQLHLRKGERWQYSHPTARKAFEIALPVGFGQVVMCGAMVAATRIVSPLGTVAIAANSFAVTAESLCYMPGYGIADAAATLVGQSIGAGRPALSRRLSWLCTGLGMAVMTGMGVLMYAAAPAMLAMLSPEPAIRALGTQVLRIEAFAEPLYAASIVAAGALRGAGDTLVPSVLNFISMWCVRIPLAAFLAPRLGLRGVWLAMAAELSVRGILFLFRLKGGRWLKPYEKAAQAEAQRAG